MLYYIAGMTSKRIREMNFKEREWWLNRLAGQLKEEASKVENFGKAIRI